MIRHLVVGDPHAVPAELSDLEALFAGVSDTLDKQPVDRVVLLGDLNHTHAVVHVDVIAFYRRWLDILRRRAPVVVIRGNHDAAPHVSEGGAPNGLMPYLELSGVRVVDEPYVDGGVAFVPYYARGVDFLGAARVAHHAGGTQTLYCHQTFDGSRYENGFFAGDGVDPNQVPQLQVISGHIHAPQSFGKVWYPGAPRWRTLADANVARAIHVVQFEADGTFASSIPVSTEPWCRVIRHSIVRDGVVVDGPDVPPLDTEPGCDWRIDLHGPREEVERARAAAHPAWKIRTFGTDKPPAKVRESAGVDVSFRGYLDSHVPKNGTPAEQLKAEACRRLGWTP